MSRLKSFGAFPGRFVTAGEGSLLFVAVASMDVARLLGTSPGRHRKGLIDKGLIYVPSRGQVAFTVPGMASFIQRVTAAESP